MENNETTNSPDINNNITSVVTTEPYQETLQEPYQETLQEPLQNIDQAFTNNNVTSVVVPESLQQISTNDDIVSFIAPETLRHNVCCCLYKIINDETNGYIVEKFYGKLVLHKDKYKFCEILIRVNSNFNITLYYNTNTINIKNKKDLHDFVKTLDSYYVNLVILHKYIKTTFAITMKNNLSNIGIYGNGKCIGCSYDKSTKYLFDVDNNNTIFLLTPKMEVVTSFDSIINLDNYQDLCKYKTCMCC